MACTVGRGRDGTCSHVALLEMFYLALLHLREYFKRVLVASVAPLQQFVEDHGAWALIALSADAGLKRFLVHL